MFPTLFSSFSIRGTTPEATGRVCLRRLLLTSWKIHSVLFRLHVEHDFFQPALNATMSREFPLKGEGLRSSPIVEDESFFRHSMGCGRWDRPLNLV